MRACLLAGMFAFMLSQAGAQSRVDLVSDLVPASSRRETRAVGLREGERELVESDDAVQITRIQRVRRR